MNNLTSSAYTESRSAGFDPEDIALSVGNLQTETWYADESIEPYVSTDFFNAAMNGIVYPAERKYFDAMDWPQYDAIVAKLAESVGSPLVTPQGRVTRRITKFLKENHGIVLSDLDVSKIGNLANERATKKLAFCLSRDFDFQRHDSYYGDSNACFHSYNAGYKYALRDSGFLVLLWRKNDTIKFARAWAHIEDSHLCLNSTYGGFRNPRDMAESFAKLFSADVSEIAYQWHGYDTYPFNNRCFAVIHPRESAGSLFSTLHLYKGDSAISEDDDSEDDRIRCEDCDELVDPEDIRYINGDPVCEDCIDNHYTQCEHCGELVHDDYLTSYRYHYNTRYGQRVETRYVCEDCRDYHAQCCTHCDEYWHEDDMTSTENGDQFCPDCVGDYVVSCEHCESLYTDGSGSIAYVESAGCYVCEDCLARHYENCAHCEESFLRTTLSHTADGHAYCEDCAHEFDSCCCCDKVYAKEDMTRDQRDHYACDTCLQSEYFTCAHCRDLVPNDDYRLMVLSHDMNTGSYSTDYLCEDCSDKYRRLNPGAKHNFTNPRVSTAYTTRINTEHYWRVWRRIENARNARHVRRINAQLRAMEKLLPS